MLCLSSCKEDSIEIIDVDGLEALLSKDNGRIQVINFWATWCAPCITEIPYFEALNRTMDNKVDVTLVSLDFLEELDQKVIPFVDKRGIRSKVVLIDEVDYNLWIDKVDPKWSGAIPFTIILDNSTGKRHLVEKQLREGEIEEILKTFSN